MRAVFLSLALGLAAGSAPADDIVERIDACIGALGAPLDHADQCLGLHAQPCMSKPEGQTTAGMVSCIGEEGAAWDAVLNREYEALRAALDEEQRAAMLDAQRKWIAFRDADCAFPRVFVRGTLAQPWAADCVMQHTARRALELRGYRDFMEN